MRLSFLVLINLFFCSVSAYAQKQKFKPEVPYNLESVFIGGQKNSMIKDKAVIIFNSTKKTAKCITSCNYIDLKYCSKKNKFKFVKIEPGSVPCPDHLLGIESDLKENFSKVNYYQVINNKLYFFNKKDTLMVFYE
ncbi:MAG: hypothetical protein Q8T03_10975 [Bacteroidota bacterium]|nr:hypothetical protein [Bacteroidota bacterium]